MSTSQARVHSYQSLIDRVRQCALSPASYSREEMLVWAEQFAELAQVAGERLDRCVELLRLGQRSEAIRLADLAPNLIDLLAALDFPELDAWRLVCEHMDLPVPRPLGAERAAELNEAYAVDQPTKQLLRQWRVEAIARAPLAQRLATLRRLVELEPQNVAWQTDLKRYESARLEQMAATLSQVYGNKDLTTLAAWIQELTTSSWSVPVPSRLVEAINKAHGELARQSARAEMIELAGRLHEAHAALDEAAGRRLRDRWRELLRLYCPPADDPLLEKAAPALDWLEQCDQRQARHRRHQRAVANLQQAVEERATVDELDRLHTQATADGYELPLELDREYRLLRQQLLAEAAVRRRLVTVAVSAVSLTLVLGLVFTIWHVAFQRTVNEHAQAVERLLEEHKIEEARHYLARLEETRPEIGQAARIMELFQRVDQMEQEEAARRQQFEALADRVAQSLPGVPDRRALQQLGELARSEQEQHRLAELQLQVQQREGQLAAENAARVRARLKEIADQLAQLEEDITQSPNATLTQIAELRSNLLVLRAENRKRNIAEFDVLLRRLETLCKQCEQRKDRARKLLALRAAIGDPVLFARRLEEFAKANPGDENAADFTTVASEAKLWAAVDAWNQAIPQWNNRPLSQLTPEEAKQRRKLLNERKAWIRTLTGSFDELDAALVAITQRVEGFPASTELLYAVWGDRLVNDLWMIQLEDGRRYYTFQSVDDVAASAKIPCVEDFDLTERKVGFLGDHIRWSGRSPQSVLAGRVRPKLDALPDSSWEETFSAVLRELFVNSRQVDPAPDPILMFVLVRRTLDVGCAGSVPISKAWDDVRKNLAATVVPDDANWLASDNSLDRYREQIKLVLAGVTDVDAREQRVRQYVTRLDSVRLPHLRWVGMLLRENGRWTLLTQQKGETPVAAKGRLFVLRPGSERPELVPVAEIAGAGPKWQPETTPASFISGRPLFAAAVSP